MNAAEMMKDLRRPQVIKEAERVAREMEAAAIIESLTFQLSCRIGVAREEAKAP